MTFVSYAQNFEDVMLWRALKHVEGGFYVDVGAQDPAIDSVSLAFYEHGWRGVHIEPSLVYADKLRRSRPDEIVIQAAIAAAPSTRVFFEIPDTGLSTADREIAERHRAQGFTVIETVVPYLTLTQALEPFAGRDIHWLKIDVEGFEGEVIQGWDATAIRPWVLVVESMAPNTPEETHLAWESQVIQRGYDFVYFDGLNRYYISADHRELAASFDRPPNYFDFFVINQVVANDAEIGRLRGCVDEVTENLAQARSDLSARDREIERLNAHIAWQQREWEVAQEGASEQTRADIAARDGEIERLKAHITWQKGVWDETQEAEFEQTRADLAARDGAIERLKAHIAWQQRAWEAAQEGEFEQARADLAARDGAIERLKAHIAWQQSAWEAAQELTRADLAARDGEIERLHTHIAWQQTAREKNRLDTESSQTQAMVAAMYASTSWRVSAPLRAIAIGTRRLKFHLSRTNSQPQTPAPAPTPAQAPAETPESLPGYSAPLIPDAGGSVDLTEYTRQVYRHLLDARATAECQQRMTLRPVEDR